MCVSVHAHHVNMSCVFLGSGSNGNVLLTIFRIAFLKVPSFTSVR